MNTTTLRMLKVKRTNLAYVLLKKAAQCVPVSNFKKHPIVESIELYGKIFSMQQNPTYVLVHSKKDEKTTTKH